MQLHFKNYGNGYPLIILHGLFGSIENWNTLSKNWSRCYRVIAVDARNHGASPHAPEMSYSIMADDLRELMDRLDISSAYLLGHSMGGKTAMQFALAHPARVDKLIVVDIAPRAYSAHHDEIYAALFSFDPTAFRNRKEIDAALAPRIADETLRQFLAKNLERDGAGRFQWRIPLDILYKERQQLVQPISASSRFQKPVLFIRGELSNYVTDQDRGPIRELFPFSKFATIPAAGHWPHSQARRKFSRLVVAFLGQA